MKKTLMLGSILCIGALGLGACAPSALVGAVQGESLAKITLAPATAVGGYSLFTFTDPDPRPALDAVAVLVGGADFRVDTAALRAADPKAKCYPKNQGWLCELGDVQNSYTLPYYGALKRAYVNFYRAGATVPRTVVYP